MPLFLLLALALFGVAADAQEVALLDCHFNLTADTVANTCSFPSIVGQSANFPTGVVLFAQSRPVLGGSSLRLKLDPTGIYVINAHIMVCGDKADPRLSMTGHPMLFHMSFDPVRPSLPFRSRLFFFFFLTCVSSTLRRLPMGRRARRWAARVRPSCKS